jgi:acyl-coenzyme A thioesterase PaaI-like protein
MSDDGRREALVRLGAAARALNEAVVTSEVPVAELEAAAAAVEAATARLGARRRARDELSAVDDLAAGGVRIFNPVSGEASPLAPPLRMRATPEGAVGYATLGLVHEGHWMYAHGGVTAALVDQLFGHAAGHRASPIVTTRLALRYRRPVPLLEPLVVRAEVDGVLGRRVTLRGSVALVAEPEVALVEAEAWFVRLSPEHAVAMFGSDRLHGGG